MIDPQERGEDFYAHNFTISCDLELPPESIFDEGFDPSLWGNYADDIEISLTDAQIDEAAFSAAMETLMCDEGRNE